MNYLISCFLSFKVIDQVFDPQNYIVKGEGVPFPQPIGWAAAVLFSANVLVAWAAVEESEGLAGHAPP